MHAHEHIRLPAADIKRILAAGFWTLEITGSDGLTAQSPGFVVLPGAASQLRFDRQPYRLSTVGMPFPSQPAVSLRDQFGNLVTAISVDVSIRAKQIAIVGRDGVLQQSLKLGGVLAATTVGGIAEFSGVYSDQAGFDLTLTATATLESASGFAQLVQADSEACVRARVRTYECTHARTHARTHASMHARTHTCVSGRHSGSFP